MSQPASASPCPIRRALLSVTHKQGLVEFARELVAVGVEILSTGGTGRLLADHGVPFVPIEDFTGMKEMLDGRVKTLHPAVYGGILARRDLETHRAEVEAHGLRWIDMIVVNLYDFAGAASAPNAKLEDVVEQIDIGGPALLRAAAKNHPFVVPLVDPDDYPRVIAALLLARDLGLDERRALALKVYMHTSKYDQDIAAYLASTLENTLDSTPAAPLPSASASRFPEDLRLHFKRSSALRYGENPHQAAAFYTPSHEARRLLAKAKQLQGKELSYNNLLDLDSALGLAMDLGSTSAVYVKHNNPCGAAKGATIAEALSTARSCDAVSAFGAVVAVSQPLDRAAAEVLTESFVEAVIAPGYSEEALAALSGKKNLRVLELEPEDFAVGSGAHSPDLEVRTVRGGILVQAPDVSDHVMDEVFTARVVTKREPTSAERSALVFTWTVAKHVRSNAIVFGREGRVVAIGAGQMSRVDSVKLCEMKGGPALHGTVVASDAFFPFRDGVDVLAAAGATAIAQPGGSIRDEEVIRAADEHGLAMLFTGVRHFRH